MSSLFARIRKLLVEDHILTRVLKNTGYLFSSTSLGLLLSLVQSIFAARLLGVAAFGLVGIVTSFVSNVNRLFSFRMGEFIIHYLGRELTEDNRQKAGAVVKAAMLTEAVTSLVAFAALLALAPFGARYIAKDMQALPMIQLFAVSILAKMVSETSLGILQITNHYRTQAVINVIQSVITALLILLAFLLQGSIYFVLSAYLVGKILLGISPAILAFYFLPRHLQRGWWKTPLSVLPPFKEIAQYTLSTNLSGTVKMLASESEPLWVGFFLDKQAVGLYKLALSIVNPLMMPITPFITTTFPEMTRSIVARLWSQLRRLLKRVTLISASWTGLVLLVMLLLGRWLIKLFYGIEFVPAYPATMVLLLGFGFANIFFWNRSLLLSFGKANIPLYVLFSAAVVKIALGFWVVPRWGIAGEAILLSLYLIISTAILVYIGLRKVRQGEKLDPAEG
ncbi:MAG TPA: oligosaccharide flippase family protein [Anaerolineaceae bacterium]|nr:oligosaccharide flippase family protein [Anaerolineaceae bacterium]